MRVTVFLVLMGLVGFQAEVTAQVHRSEAGAGGAVCSSLLDCGEVCGDTSK